MRGMTQTPMVSPSDMFIAVAPGLEQAALREITALDLGTEAVPVPGGVTLKGGWPEVWRANLCLRTASRILLRVAEFRAMHPAQLDKRARKVDWRALLRPDVPIRVEATCRKSKIYHQGAAADRVAAAIVDQVGCPVVQVATEDAISVKVRIEDDLCTISLDTTGEVLHRRGHKEAVGKAPLRETLAAAFLGDCGYTGAEAVVDPMCGSGTFVLEAAEIAAGLWPGRSRAFAFERLAGFDAKAWAKLKASAPKPRAGQLQFWGYDRDQGAVQGATANAERAGLADWVQIARQAVSELEPPAGVAPGLVMVNPPYGARIGNRKLLFGLYGAFGKVMEERFAGWRVGLVTSDPGLAKATGLPFVPTAGPVDLGGLKVQLYRTEALGGAR